jgi:hypothetical protein
MFDPLKCGTLKVGDTVLEKIKSVMKSWVMPGNVMPGNVGLLVVLGFRRELHDRQVRKQLKLASDEATHARTEAIMTGKEAIAAELYNHKEAMQASDKLLKAHEASHKAAIAVERANHKEAMKASEKLLKASVNLLKAHVASSDKLLKAHEASHKEAMQASEKLLNAHVSSGEKLVKAHVASSDKLVKAHEVSSDKLSASLKEVSDAKLAVAKQNTEANVASAAHMSSMVDQMSSLMAAEQESRSQSAATPRLLGQRTGSVTTTDTQTLRTRKSFSQIYHVESVAGGSPHLRASPLTPLAPSAGSNASGSHANASPMSCSSSQNSGEN